MMKQQLLKRYILFFLIAIICVFADQYSKYLIQQNVQFGDIIEIWSIFGITHIHNTGAAWGIFHNNTSALAVFSLVVSIIFLIVFLFSHKVFYLNNNKFVVALSLIWGGTIGNWIDRQFLGYVTDFIHVGSFPNFNIADSCIVCGSILLAIILIFFTDDKNTTSSNDTDKE